MNKKIKKYILIFQLSILIIFIISCSNNNKTYNEIPEQKERSNDILKKIKERGRIIALTDYNSTNYFIYKGEPMGYQYELLKSFAKYLDVKLEIVINSDIEKSFEYLNKESCDLIAMGLTVTNKRIKIVDFSYPLSQTRQVLVQRKPDNWRKMRTWNDIEKKLIRNPLELAGKTIYIQKNTSFYNRLINLSDEIGDSIYIIEDPEKQVEELITCVVNGEIDFTVCDEHIALVNQKYYPDIDVNTPISFHQNIAWAVKKGSNELLSEINKWLVDFKKTKIATYIYNKYFKNPRSVYIAQSEFYSVKGGKISRYDDLMKKHSKLINWDWRLLASLIYQESRFHPEAKSWVGAIGLMQLMPSTAKKYSIDTLSPPEKQIEAGVKFIKLLNKQFINKIDDNDERLKFVLASYNAGIAHVYDARRLAEKNNKDSDIWTDNVDYFLLQKSKPEYYNDPVVKYGYCRGQEPYDFVYEILDRYEHYKNIITY